jgi:hypothetical protein
MRRISVVLLLLVMSAGMLGCASTAEPPRRDVYSDPDAARARSAERTQELDRNIQK